MALKPTSKMVVNKEAEYVYLPNGARAICMICGSYHAVEYASNPSLKIYRCGNCALCRECGGTFNSRETISPYCAKCVCQSCGGWSMLPGTRKDGLCHPCWFKKNSDKACKRCGLAFATIEFRFIDRRRPTYCVRCAKVAIETEFHKCNFCHGRANFISHSVPKVPKLGEKQEKLEAQQYLLCDSCSTVVWCGLGGCLPTRQCKSCKQQQMKVENPSGHKPELGKDCRCGNCNDYRERRLFHFINKNTRFWTAEHLKDRIHNRSPRMAAVEIEVGGLRKRREEAALLISDVARKWEMSGIVTDESLKAGGFEINTAPAGGDILLRQIDEICDALKKNNAYVDSDGRCGTHVHIDVRDFDYFSLRRLLILYAIVEPALIRTQPYKRIFKVDSHGQLRSHCMPCGMQYAAMAQNMTSVAEIKAALGSKLYDNQFGVRPPKKKRGNNRSIASRYYFLNVHSFFHLGTVECRGHAGTIRADKIKKWTRMWIDLVDAAYKMTEKQILALRGDPLEVLCSLVNKESADYVRNRFSLFAKEFTPMERII